MTVPVVFHEGALRDLEDAVAYYNALGGHAGRKLAFAVEQAVASVAAMPQAGRPLSGGRRVWRVQHFPYAICYRLSDDALRVLAVSHHRRRPSYWLSRD